MIRLLAKLKMIMTKQTNFVSKAEYGGQNQVELLNAKEVGGFNSDEWLTFLQAKGAGLKIKKGAHGVAIFKGFGKFDDISTKADGTPKVEYKSRPLGFARVFNLDQTEKFEVLA
ncbi:MAG TPA: ArdC family protein [Gammaproteobacteria bacterium]|nr:ArdC family protein [Gammaproteobacteria bacterium]